MVEYFIISAPEKSGSNDPQQEAFIKAMSEGGGNLSQSNIVMHGPPGAGKTSLKRVILGQPPLSKKEQNSTNIIENAVRAVRTEQLKQFEVVDNEQMIVNLAKRFKNLPPIGHKPLPLLKKIQIVLHFFYMMMTFLIFKFLTTPVIPQLCTPLIMS